jgi:tetratricopeptide (TPR) repeat protein
LVDAATGNQLWGDQYTRKMTDLIELQSEIVRDVSLKLKSRLTGADTEKIARNYTQNTEAYQHYLRARYHWNRRTTGDVKKSLEYFQQAIDKDATYAQAYAGLSEAYILAPAYGAGTPHDAYPKARKAAQRAIEIDGSLAEAHNALAAVMSNYEWKFSEAEAEWQKALALNPNYATGRQWYAEHLLFMGRFDEGLAEMKRAQALDPLSLIINCLVGVAYRINGQYEESHEQLRKTLEMDPNFPRTHLFLAELHQTTGRYNEAIDEFAKLFILMGEPEAKVEQFAVSVKRAYKTDGAKGYARAMAETLTSNRERAAPPATVLAAYWAEAGETDKAFEVLEEAYRDHDERLLMLKDPRMDPLKADARYKDLVRRVGLPQ